MPTTIGNDRNNGADHSFERNREHLDHPPGTALRRLDPHPGANRVLWVSRALSSGIPKTKKPNKSEASVVTFDGSNRRHLPR